MSATSGKQDREPVGSGVPSGEQATPVRRERIEWCDMWVPDATGEDLPRVLLVGDSITKGYYGAAEKALRGKAAVARMATSAFMSDPAFVMQLDCLLDAYRFDVIHFNNGLHGWSYSEKEYEAALSEVMAHIRRKEPDATLLLANSTPLRERSDLTTLRDRNARVVERNHIVARFGAANGIPVNDLYGLVADKPNLYSGDGTHFGTDGRELQGQQVAEVVSKALAGREDGN